MILADMVACVASGQLWLEPLVGTQEFAKPGVTFRVEQSPVFWIDFDNGTHRTDAPLPGTWDAKRRCSIAAPQPAIVIPWYRGGKVVAVRYRFVRIHEYPGVDSRERKVKQSSIYGSDFADIL